MKRYSRKIEWDRKAVLGLSLTLLVILSVSQIPNYLYAWPLGPNIGYRMAGFTSGHYQRKFPTIRRDMKQLGRVWIGSNAKLIIDYDLTLHEGTASFGLRKWPILANQPRNVGPGSIDDSRRGRIEVAPGEPGFYRINMYAHWFQGAVSVDWRTEDAGR